MEIRDLKYYIKLCDEKNFSKAAQTLFITQSALTKAIQRMENELKVPLIDRSVKYFKLTEVGKNMYVESKLFVEKFDSMINDVKNGKNF